MASSAGMPASSALQEGITPRRSGPGMTPGARCTWSRSTCTNGAVARQQLPIRRHHAAVGRWLLCNAPAQTTWMPHTAHLDP
jgi:hypothetical protein